MDRLGSVISTYTRYVSNRERRWARRRVSSSLSDNQHLSSATAWSCLGLVKCGHLISRHIYPENWTLGELRVYFKQISRKENGNTTCLVVSLKLIRRKARCKDSKDLNS